MTSNWPKIDFSDLEFRLISENRIFWPQILKITKTMFTLPKTTIKTACNDVLFLLKFMTETINFWSWDKKLHLFLDIYFCMDIMMEMVREDVLTTYFGSTWSRATKEIADKSTERACRSKWGHKRMETKKNFFQSYLTPPFCHWIRPKSINHMLCKQKK